MLLETSRKVMKPTEKALRLQSVVSVKSSLIRRSPTTQRQDLQRRYQYQTWVFRIMASWRLYAATYNPVLFLGLLESYCDETHAPCKLRQDHGHEHQPM